MNLLCFCFSFLKAMEVEKAMSSELQALKQELQQKGNQNRPQDEELISAMREQVTTEVYVEATVCSFK